MNGSEMKRARAVLGLTQNALATQLDLSVFTIQHYEQERNKIPRTVEYAILHLLNISGQKPGKDSNA